MGRTNFFYLLIALLILLIGIPLADDLELASAPLVRGSAFSLLLIIGVWSLRGGAKVFRVGMTFAVIGVVLNLLAANSDSIALLYGSFLALLARFCAEQSHHDQDGGQRDAVIQPALHAD